MREVGGKGAVRIIKSTTVRHFPRRNSAGSTPTTHWGVPLRRSAIMPTVRRNLSELNEPPFLKNELILVPFRFLGNLLCGLFSKCGLKLSHDITPCTLFS